MHMWKEISYITNTHAAFMFFYDTQNSLGCTSVLSLVSHRNYPGSKDGHIHTLLYKRGTAEFVLGPDGNSLSPTGQ